MDCPRGKINRSSYTRTTSSGKKIKVKTKCIKAQSQSGKKRSDLDKKIMAKKKREHTIARQKFGTPKCKKGYIIKEGYHKKSTSRSNGTWIPPTCAKARGSSAKRGTKGKKLFRLESGTLGQFGYKKVKKLSKSKRRSSLKKALRKLKPLSVQRKLNAVAILQKNIDPKLTNILRNDIEWVKNTKEYKNRNKK
jgi:Family of unknown function (DUF5771)